MSFDWSQGGIDHELRVQTVDPLNLSTVRGELKGVNPSGRLSLDYYSDRRMGAEVTTSVPIGETDGWDGTAALRILHDVLRDGETLLTETLGTFYVTSAPWEDQSGIRTTKYSLTSTIYGIETNTVAGTYSIPKGATALDVMGKVMKGISRPWRKRGSAKNYKFAAGVVYPLSSSYLSILFDLCDRSRNRLSVDPDGFVTVDQYVAPSTKSPCMDVSVADERSGVIEPIGGSDTSLETPERVVVTSTKDKRNVVGTAVAPAGTASRHSVRGYCVDSVHAINDMNPFTKAQAEKLAKQYLASELQVARERTLGLEYRPLREGDVITLTDNDGTKRWLVKSAELDLGGWEWKLTLTGGW